MCSGVLANACILIPLLSFIAHIYVYSFTQMLCCGNLYITQGDDS